jgi:hypothetical protein
VGNEVWITTGDFESVRSEFGPLNSHNHGTSFAGGFNDAGRLGVGKTPS